MTQCVVICHQCIDDAKVARRWRENCVDCAETIVANHRRRTGHTDIELRVTEEQTIEHIRQRIASRRAQAWFQSRKYGW